MGYLIMENGIFLLSLAIGSDMPHIVSLGVSLI
jgi:hydrogenase-4 membrane subunit HyfE